ncbi:MAG: HlyD family efflux transporter periplasmic adaptor subunit [Phycisphaerales bacterium]|nr:HlyD family efflux transporter periplasmic adaptor subunit [Phycisphaerales bacterium]
MIGTQAGAPTKAPASQSGKPAERQTSDIVVVAVGDFDISTTATGDLKARNQIEIRSTIDTETSILEIIPEGSSVKAGDVLVQLNAEPIQTRVDEESLQLESARASLVEAEQGYQIQLSENESAKRQAELKVALGELDLAQWQRGEVESKRQELDHDVDKTTKDFDRLKDKLEKSRSLQEKGYYSLDQLKQDELAYEQAEAARDKAVLAKTVYWEFQHPKDKRKKESDLEEARAELDRVMRQNASKLASKEADLNNKRQSLQIRQQKHDKARSQLQAASIKAPSDGLVVYGSSIDNARWGGDDGPLQVGKKVFPNELLVVLPDTTEMIAAVKVHESLAGRIRPGQQASVKIDAAGGRVFPGKVESIGILAEQTSRWMDPNLREYTVRIALELSGHTGTEKSAADEPIGADMAQAPAENVATDATPKIVTKPTTDAAKTESGKAEKTASSTPDHGLKPSMRCEAEIFLGKVRDALNVPIQAVFSDGLVRYVHVVDPTGSGKFIKRPVQIGQRSDRFAEIRAGLSAGERVLIRRPEAIEVLGKNWDAKELAAVGLKLDEQGSVIPIAGAGQRPGARPGGPPAAAGGGAAPAGAGSRPARPPG